MNWSLSFPLLCLLVVWPASLLPAAAPAPVQVNHQKVQVERKTFDPDRPPAAMPTLSHGEAAVCDSSFGIASEVRTQVLAESQHNGRHVSTVKVESIQVTPSLRITLWLPVKAPRALVEHEEAHRKLAEMFYQGAGTIARNEAQKLIGKTYSAEGRTVEAARRAAVDKAVDRLNSAYLEATQVPAADVNAIFDDVTDHGRNPDLTAAEGIKVALARYRAWEKRTRSGQGR